MIIPLFLFVLCVPLLHSQSTPIPLQNNTPITINTPTAGYFNYSFAITSDMVPISVNILLEATVVSSVGQLFSAINSSSFCTYTPYPTSVNYCEYSGWVSSYSLISINFAQSDTLAIGALIQTLNVDFKLKILAYPLMQIYNGSTIDVNSLDSVHAYIFTRYYSFVHDPSIVESLYLIAEGKSALDFGALYVSVNCSNRLYNPFPSSVSNFKGNLYSDKSMYLQINLDSPCIVSIALSITGYSMGFNLKALSYPPFPLNNGTTYNIDSLNSTKTYTGFYRYFSYTSKTNESPGSINLVVNGLSTTDQTRVYAKTACSNTCTFSAFPDTLNNCFSTPYSNPSQILTVTYDYLCYVTVAVLVDVFSQGVTIRAVIYPATSLKNNTYATIYPINTASSVQPFWRYFAFQAKIVGSVDILLEGLTASDIGGVYADTDCDGGCAFSNFPSKSSNCYRKYESQNSFVVINLDTTCNISIGVYVSQLSASMQIKTVLYPIFNLPNGIPVLIDSFGSRVGYENFDRFFNYQLKDTDAMGNLTIVLDGISSGDPSQMFVTTDCQLNCSWNKYPNSNGYCYQTSYNTIGTIQIYLAKACNIRIAAHIVSYRFGSRLTATYYNVCPDKINGCVTCNQSAIANSTNLTYMCYGCKNYYAPTTDHLGCQFCNITVGYFVDTTNNGFCSQCQNNCFNCTDGNTCLQCSQGYLFNQVSPTKSNCLCSVSNCTNCTTGGQCVSCDSGFGLYSSSNLCIPCQIPNCQTCSFNSNYQAQCDICANDMIYYNGSCQTCGAIVKNCTLCQDAHTCVQCVPGTYLTSAGQCNPCGDSNTIGCTSCFSDFTCSSCLNGYYLNSDDNCRPCKSLYPNCDKCSMQDCLQCSNGYWYNGTTSSCNKCIVGNCSQCQNPNVCDSCMPSFTLYNNTCLSCNNGTNLSNCMTCDLGSSSKNVCLACNPTFYMDDTLVCQTCFTISPSCLACQNSSYCTQCLYTSLSQTYLYQDPSDSTSSTCVPTCPSTHIANLTSQRCDLCVNTFGHGCLECNSTSCTQCGAFEPYFYGNSCSICNATNQQIVNTNYCYDTPKISFINVSNIGCFVNLQVNCSVISKVFFIYGLLASTDSDVFSSVSNLTSVLPTTDFLYDWKGKGMFTTDSTGYLNQTLNGPFKNDGQLYKMRVWCKYTNNWGSLVTPVSVINWTQYDNGAKIVEIRVNTTNYINFNNKPLVAKAIQMALGIQRDVYTEDFIPASSYQTSRLRVLQEKKQDFGRGLQYIYNYTFYIVPDYKIYYDYMESVVNSSFANSTLFAINVQKYISSMQSTITFGILNVQFVARLTNNGEAQGFFTNYPQVSAQNTTVLVKYILKTQGNLYFGMRATDNTTSVNSQGVVNASLSWPDFKNKLDYSGNQLKWYSIYQSQPNILLTVNFSGLNANSTYFVFLGAGSSGLPENLTNIQILSIKTGWLWDNSTNTSFSQCLNVAVWVLVVVGILVWSI